MAIRCTSAAGRADETLFLVQGVANRDLVTGQPTAGQLNARSVAEVNVATGAYDVRYGNALSGVVEVRLKEGGDHFQGGFTTAGETYGGRAWQLTLGGPMGFAPAGKGKMTWFMDVSGDYQATRFPEHHPGVRRSAPGVQLRGRSVRQHVQLRLVLGPVGGQQLGGTGQCGLEDEYVGSVEPRLLEADRRRPGLQPHLHQCRGRRRGSHLSVAVEPAHRSRADDLRRQRPGVTEVSPHHFDHRLHRVPVLALLQRAAA
jgi:hypothetical protein